MDDPTLSKIIHGYKVPSDREKKLLSDYLSSNKRSLKSMTAHRLKGGFVRHKRMATDSSRPDRELVVPPAARCAAVRVRSFDATMSAHWDRFIRQQPEATFFHQLGWKR